MDYHKKYKELMEQCYTEGGASEADIRTAEKDLNITFPDAYRTFLADYGAAIDLSGALQGSLEISGLYKLDGSQPMCSHVVQLTMGLRKSLQTNKPGKLHALLTGIDSTNLLEISDDGSEIRFYIDANGAPECPVYGIGAGFEEQKIADSFEEFVVKAATTDDYGLSEAS